MNTENQTQTIPQEINEIHWKKMETYLKKRFKRDFPMTKIDKKITFLKGLVPHLGERSQSKKALYNIGTNMFGDSSVMRIISPICLDIPHGGYSKIEVPELVLKHVDFLKACGNGLPRWRLTCLFPVSQRETDKERVHIQEIFGLTKQYALTTDFLEAEMMDECFPAILASEERAIQEIHESSRLLKLSEKLAVARSRYYASLNIPQESWARKTRRTMAQYITLGRFAASQGMLICNHTSANISCYLYAGAGVLHNPVGFR